MLNYTHASMVIKCQTNVRLECAYRKKEENIFNVLMKMILIMSALFLTNCIHLILLVESAHQELNAMAYVWYI